MKPIIERLVRMVLCAIFKQFFALTTQLLRVPKSFINGINKYVGNVHIIRYIGTGMTLKSWLLSIGTRSILVSVVAAVSQASLAVTPLTNTEVWLSNGVETLARVGIADEFPDDPGSIGNPPIDTDPEPACTASSRTYSVTNELLNLLGLLLNGSRLQISHTGQGVPLVGQPRTINFFETIPIAKFELLEKAQEQRCEHKPNPTQCMNDWYQDMNEQIVYTIEPKHHSYVDWSDSFSNVTGLSFTPVPVPVVEKPVQSKIAKAVTTLLIWPIAVNVDKARCFINQVESNFNHMTHPIDIKNGRLEIGMTLKSVGSPTLKCEGRAVALWGLHTWGWADKLFPDINLTNMKVAASLGDFRVVDDMPMFSTAKVDVQASVDLNNIPDIGESVISFFKDYSKKARNKVADALRKKLASKKVREAFGHALVDLVEKNTGDQVDRVCAVHAAGDNVDIEYETVIETDPVINVPAGGFEPILN
ncbi:MAG: hypothetical protein V3U75_03605 [Methylococcaceae bacterium]